MTNTDFNQRYDDAVSQEADGDRDGAIQALRMMLAEDPNYALAHTALSAMYNRAGKVDQAIEHAKRYTELEPEDAFGYTILSSLCIKLGRREEAEDALMSAQQQQMREFMAARQAENQENKETEA